MHTLPGWCWICMDLRLKNTAWILPWSDLSIVARIMECLGAALRKDQIDIHFHIRQQFWYMPDFSNWRLFGQLSMGLAIHILLYWSHRRYVERCVVLCCLWHTSKSPKVHFEMAFCFQSTIAKKLQNFKRRKGVHRVKHQGVPKHVEITQIHSLVGHSDESSCVVSGNFSFGQQLGCVPDELTVANVFEWHFAL